MPNWRIRERRKGNDSLIFPPQQHPEPEHGIPRIIHQTFSRRENLPALLEENCRAIEAINPDFEYRFYSNEDIEVFIRRVYGLDILCQYLRIDPSFGAARADLFRYLCLYHHGGVYLDVKAKVEQPFSSVLRADDTYILAQWDHSPGSRHRGWGTHPKLRSVPGGEYQQWHIIASPRHPYLAAVIRAVLHKIETYNAFSFPQAWEAVLLTTGPVIYTEAIHPIRQDYPHRLLESTKELGLAYSIFEDSENPEAHRGLYRDYRALETPLIRQRFPLSLILMLRAGILALLRRMRRRLRR